SAAGAAAGSGAGSGSAAATSSAGSAVGSAVRVSPPEPPPSTSSASAITASSAPTSTVSSSAATIRCRMPAAGEGISVSTLSVDTSSSGSSTSTRSPSCLSHRVTVPSVTLSPRAGIWTEKAISGRSSSSCGFGVLLGRAGSAVAVERLAGEREVRFPERLVLGGVSVHECGDVLCLGVPVVDELGLADELADAGADHVDADDRARRALGARLDELDGALGLEDLALAVAREVVHERLDVAVLLPRLRLGEADRGDLRLAVGDARDARLVDRRGGQPRDLLGHEDALLEPAVGQLQAGDDVAEGVHVRQVGAQPLVDEHEPALHRD